MNLRSSSGIGTAISIFAFTFSLVGCSGQPSRVYPPAYNSNAGAAALTAYDSNGDGAISGPEFDRVPALRASLEQVDLDNDSRLTAQEISGRVAQWIDTKIGEMPVRCEVFLDGQPLNNAEVVFEPEPFLGSKVRGAKGVSSNSGTAGISLAQEYLADPKYPGMACGWYKIRVTSAAVALPARYNTETVLGCEVAMDAAWISHGAVELKLESR